MAVRHGEGRSLGGVPRSLEIPGAVRGHRRAPAVSGTVDRRQAVAASGLPSPGQLGQTAAGLWLAQTGQDPSKAQWGLWGPRHLLFHVLPTMGVKAQSSSR